MDRSRQGGQSEYRRERDAKINASTALPAGESVLVPAIWVIEVFTPTMIASLKAGAEKLGWDSDDLPLNADFLDRIGDWRSKAAGGGMLNLGYIVPPGTTSRIFGNREAPLANGVRAIHATILQPFPSTTILCLQFILEEPLASSLNGPLSEHFTSYDEPIGDTARRVVSVEFQKKLAIDTARGALHSICTSWVTEHFPGFFAKKECQAPIPTWELLLVTQTDEFFNRRSSISEPTYLDMLGLQDRGDTWSSEELPGLYLLLRDRDEPGNRAVLYGNIDSALSTKDIQSYGDGKAERVVHWLQYLDRTLTLWTVSLLAEEVIAQLGRARDAYGSIDVAHPDSHGALDARELDQSFLSIQRTALPYAHDLASYCEHERLVLHDVFEFTRVRKFGDEETRLFAGLRRWLLYSAKEIKALEEQIRFISAQTTRQLSIAKNEELAETNIRLQHQIGAMTFVMLILTAVMAVDPIKVFWQFLKEFWSGW